MDKFANFEHDLIFEIAKIKNGKKDIYHRIHWSEVKMEDRLSVYLGYEISATAQFNFTTYLEEKFNIEFKDEDIMKMCDHKTLVKDVFTLLREYGVIDIQKERKDKLKKINESFRNNLKN